MLIAQRRQDACRPFRPQADECPVGWSHGLADLWVTVGKTFLETLLEQWKPIAFLKDVFVVSMFADECLEPSSGIFPWLDVLVVASRPDELHEVDIV